MSNEWKKVYGVSVAGEEKYREEADQVLAAAASGDVSKIKEILLKLMPKQKELLPALAKKSNTVQNTAQVEIDKFNARTNQTMEERRKKLWKSSEETVLVGHDLKPQPKPTPTLILENKTTTIKKASPFSHLNDTTPTLSPTAVVANNADTIKKHIPFSHLQEGGN